MSDLNVDTNNFWSRYSNLKKSWMSEREVEGSVWYGVDALVISMGKPSESNTFLTESFQRYWLGVIITNFIIVILQDEIWLIGTKKKCQIISSAQSAKESVKITSFEFQKEFDDVLDTVKSKLLESNIKKIGTVSSENQIGPLTDSWNAKIADIEAADISPGLQAILVFKDDEELKIMQNASEVLSRGLKRVFIKRMEGIFEDGKEEPHNSLSKNLESFLLDPSKMKMKDINKDELEMAFEPMIQSGGTYDLELGSKNSSSNMSSDILICQMALSYMEYNAILGRTFLVDPTDSVRAAYEALASVHKMLIEMLVPGNELGTIYNTVREKALEKAPMFEKSFPKNLGWGVGLDIVYQRYSIRAGNKQVVKKNMTFVVTTGISDLSLPDDEKKGMKSLKNGKYSLLITNTVIVTDAAAKVITEHDYTIDNIKYEMEDSEEESGSGSESSEASDDAVTDFIPARRVTRASNKTAEELEQEKQNQGIAAQIAKHQVKLMKQKAKTAVEADGDVEPTEKEKGEDVADIVAYKSHDEFPRELVPNKIYCHSKKECVFLPIAGRHIPFHISTIKSVVLDEDHMRFNFVYPTSTSGYAKDIPNTMVKLMDENPEFNFIKEISYKSKDTDSFNTQFRMIKDLQKQIRRTDKHNKEEAIIVEQVDLVLNRARGSEIRLDVSIKPALGKNKNMGRLMAHMNGLQFRTNRGEIVDIIYANIRNFIFQEARHSTFVAIHFHLVNPIKVGTHLTSDIQFYQEVVSASEQTHGHNMTEDAEMRDEERERKFIKTMTKKFRTFGRELVKFCEENNQKLGVDNDMDTLDYPSTFSATWMRDQVYFTPTTHCLVSLTGNSPFVVNVDDIEHVHFERVTTYNKNFDMVIITKEHAKPGCRDDPYRIGSIDISSLDNIKLWLHSKGTITFTQGSISLNLKAVMSAVYDSMLDGVFWKDEQEIEDDDGNLVTVRKDIGWNILNQEGAESSESEEEESAESAYEEDSGDSDDDSDDDDDESLESDEESSSEAGSEEESEGDDWDELEKQAESADRKTNKKERMRQEEQNDRRAKKPRR